MPGRRRAATRRSHVTGSPGCASRNACDARLQRSIVSIASSCASRSARGVAQPGLFGLRQLLPQRARRVAVSAFRQRHRGERPQPGRRARQLRGRLKRRRRGLVVAQVPVVDEPEVHHVLPLGRLRGDSFLQQRDGEIGPAGPARIRLAEVDGAEPVGDAEVRIQRGRQIEQRVQQRVGALTCSGGDSRSSPKCCSARIQ